MSSLLENLLEEEVVRETPKLLKLSVVDLNADSALVTYQEVGGAVVTGALPVNAANPRMKWEVGAQAWGVRVASNPQPMLNCTDTLVVERAFASVVPEIRTGEIQVMGAVRKAGMRTKIAVASAREGLDPVAALVGRSHNRVDYVKELLLGEQVDVVAYHPDTKVFLANALQPAKVSGVSIDEKKEMGYAKAPGHQMAAAVGTGGLNSALAASLVGLAGVKISPIK